MMFTTQHHNAMQKFLLWAYGLPTIRKFRSTAIGEAVYRFAYWRYKDWFEVPGAAHLAHYIPADAWAVDVGANIGYFTEKFASWVSGDGRVLALEPEHSNFQRLSARLARQGLWDRVVAKHAAATARTEPVFMRLNHEHPGDHALAASGVATEGLSIDDVLTSYGDPRVGLMKIDTQGAEMMVLAGADRMISRSKPAIFIEVDDAGLRTFGSSAAQVLAWIAERGYGFAILGRSRPQEAKLEDILAICTGPNARYVDVLCIPDR